MNMLHIDTKVDFKALSEEGTFEGYASVFGEVDSGKDIVEKGAFKKSLRGRSPKMLFMHDTSLPIGVWTKAEEDSRGLKVEGKLIPTIAKGAEVLEMLRAGVMDGLSIGFRTVKASFDEKTGIRRLLEIDLWEISVVTFPMLNTATIDAVKNNASKRDVEQILRDGGLPNGFAKKVVAGGYDLAARQTAKAHRDDGSGITDLLRQATETMRGAN